MMEAGGKGNKLRSRAKRGAKNHSFPVKAEVDAIAAAFILQGFLDSLRDKEQCQDT
jgi:RNase H-fold protein (predicted Holliday junction resolvase)